MALVVNMATNREASPISGSQPDLSERSDAAIRRNQ
jgi:hypothetical protein